MKLMSGRKEGYPHKIKIGLRLTSAIYNKHDSFLLPCSLTATNPPSVKFGGVHVVVVVVVGWGVSPCVRTWPFCFDCRLNNVNVIMLANYLRIIKTALHINLKLHVYQYLVYIVQFQCINLVLAKTKPQTMKQIQIGYVKLWCTGSRALYKCIYV